MKAILQRVSAASVSIDDCEVSKIDRGFLVLLGVIEGDSVDDAHALAMKMLDLRIFEDDAKKMNLSIRDIKGELLIVSQFTLAADLKRGRRPSFDKAAKPAQAKDLYEFFCSICSNEKIPVKTGQFGADMQVSLINDGPVTIILDSAELTKN